MCAVNEILIKFFTTNGTKHICKPSIFQRTKNSYHPESQADNLKHSAWWTNPNPGISWAAPQLHGARLQPPTPRSGPPHTSCQRHQHCQKLWIVSQTEQSEPTESSLQQQRQHPNAKDTDSEDDTRPSQASSSSCSRLPCPISNTQRPGACRDLLMELWSRPHTAGDCPRDWHQENTERKLPRSLQPRWTP